MRIRTENKLVSDFDALVVGIFSDEDNLPSLLDDKTRDMINKIKELGAVSKPMEMEYSVYPDGGPARRLLVVCAGKQADLKAGFARKMAGTTARSLRKKGAKKIAFALPFGSQEPAAIAQAYAEGIVLSTFDPGIYHTGDNRDEKILDDVVFISDQSADIKDALERGNVVGEGANYSRALAHEPASNMYPARLAEEAQKMAESHSLEFHSLDKAQLTEGGFKAILAVGQGSVNEPRMIVVKYKGAGDDKPWFGLVAV
jgi:leucyl aminopeptidase